MTGSEIREVGPKNGRRLASKIGGTWEEGTLKNGGRWRLVPQQRLFI